jgi:diguanylate cyclase (GGDEF)-like protein
MKELKALTALYEATRAIGLSDSLDEVLDNILRRAEDLIGFEHCCLMLVDDDTGDLVVKRVRGYGHRVSQVLGLRLANYRGLSGWAAKNRESVRVGDVGADPRYVSGLAEARSNLAVPLVAGNELAGVINAESPRADAFTAEHEKLLTVLGSQAALAIVAAQAREQLEQRILHLDALYQISQLSSRHEDLDGVLDTMLEVSQTLIPLGQIAILLLDERRETLRVRVSQGYAEGVEGLVIPLGKGVTGRAAQTGETIVVNDLAGEADHIPGVSGARSEIAVPLVVEGRVIGVLNSEALDVNAYSPDQVRMLSVIAQQAAVVLRTAQLHAETWRLSITDPLTGVFNRREYIRRLEEHLLRAKRYGESLAVVFLDLDHFKSLNDRYGHDAGDLALQQVAEALRRAMRDNDTVARIGGEEFAVLLDRADLSEAIVAAERLRVAIESARLDLGCEPIQRVTVSGGIAVYPDDGLDAKTLLRRADTALYDAKSGGRNRILLAREVADSLKNAEPSQPLAEEVPKP